MTMSYTEEAKIPLMDTGSSNWGAVLNGILTQLDEGYELNFIAEENLEQYDVVYISDENKVSKADADNAVKCPGIGIALTTAAATTEVQVLMFGWLDYDDTNHGGALGASNGDTVYLSTTAGYLTIVPNTDYPQVIGIAKSNTVAHITKIFISPVLHIHQLLDKTESPQFTGISLLADGANLLLRNTVNENGNDQAETEIFFQDHSSTSLGKIRVSHAGSADDTKGLMRFYTHTGSALTLGLKISETQEIGIPGTMALYGGATNPLICHISGATTGSCRFRMQNSGNFLDWGVESSAGGIIFPFTSAYSAVFGSTSAVSLHLCTNNAKRLTIDSSGQIIVEEGLLICGLDSDKRGSITLWDGSGGNQPGYILAYSPNGTGWYIFVEDDGTVKVHNAIPTQNADGSVIGEQID